MRKLKAPKRFACVALFLSLISLISLGDTEPMPIQRYPALTLKTELLFQVERNEVRLEVVENYTSYMPEPEYTFALWDGRTNHFLYVKFPVKDLEELVERLSMCLDGPNFPYVIYPSPGFYNPRASLQILSLVDSVLVRMVNWETQFFIQIKLTLEDAKELMQALEEALG